VTHLSFVIRGHIGEAGRSMHLLLVGFFFPSLSDRADFFRPLRVQVSSARSVNRNTAVRSGIRQSLKMVVSNFTNVRSTWRYFLGKWSICHVFLSIHRTKMGVMFVETKLLKLVQGSSGCFRLKRRLAHFVAPTRWKAPRTNMATSCNLQALAFQKARRCTRSWSCCCFSGAFVKIKLAEPLTRPVCFVFPVKAESNQLES
jgi:hypothetical protein